MRIDVWNAVSVAVHVDEPVAVWLPVGFAQPVAERIAVAVGIGDADDSGNQVAVPVGFDVTVILTVAVAIDVTVTVRHGVAEPVGLDGGDAVAVHVDEPVAVAFAVSFAVTFAFGPWLWNYFFDSVAVTVVVAVTERFCVYVRLEIGCSDDVSQRKFAAL
jgi:hypothetical protein